MPTVALVAVIVAVAAYFTLGMPGMDHGASGDMAGMNSASMAVQPDEFARRVEARGAFVVNVHVPVGVGINGTDATIAYDQIVGDDRLPSDKATPILVYCETGPMSAQAAAALMTAGYGDVVYLDGGLEAWKAVGRALE
ncbi:MAG: rhodanese-like domain-containing protein [Acidimicrobiia bacterium]